MIDPVNVRALGFASAVAIAVGVSPGFVAAAEASAKVSGEVSAKVSAKVAGSPAAGAAANPVEMGMAPEAPGRNVLGDVRDWTGLVRIPDAGNDGGADARNALDRANGLSTWLSGLVERATGAQKSALTERGAL